MPYYKETRLGKTLPSSHGAGYESQPSTLIMDGSILQGFRAKRPKADLVEEIPDHIADPYAYFLQSTFRDRYDRAIKARGYDSPPLPKDNGHTFSFIRWSIEGNPSTFSEWNKGYPYQKYGTFENVLLLRSPAASGGAGWGVSPVASDLANFAQLAWNRVAPTSEVFDLGQFAGEVREGLPSIVPALLKSKINFFKSLGSDYLNVQFGWIPFLNDLRNAVYAFSRAQYQLQTVVGPLHRKYGRKQSLLSTEATYSSANTYSGMLPSELRPALVALGLPNADRGGGPTFTASVRASRTVSRDQWLEGVFIGLPKIGYDPTSYFSRLDALIDLRITPSTLWELSPWSWLVDWGFRIGDSIEANLSLADDRIHAQYAYAMEETRDKHYYNVTASTLDTTTRRYEGWKNQYLVFNRTEKRRVRANPFGFTLGGASALSTGQLAILGALGLTKIRG